MPTYCYTTEGGAQTCERVFPMGKAPATVQLNGAVAHRDLHAELCGGGRKRPGDIWPLHSTSMGVIPQQIDEAYAESVKRGVPTRFDEQGRRIFDNRAHRTRWCRANGVKDLDGGYGDYTG